MIWLKNKKKLFKIIGITVLAFSVILVIFLFWAHHSLENKIEERSVYINEVSCATGDYRGNSDKPKRGYYLEDKQIWYYSNGSGRDSLSQSDERIKVTDDTFAILNDFACFNFKGDTQYATDGKSVFLQGRKFTEYNGERLNIFAFPNTEHVIIGNKLFYRGKQVTDLITAETPFYRGNGGIYVVSGEKVFFDGHVVEGIDGLTFTPAAELNYNQYFKDGDYVYHNQIPISNDPENFTVYKPRYNVGFDSTSVFLHGERIVGITPGEYLAIFDDSYDFQVVGDYLSDGRNYLHRIQDLDSLEQINRVLFKDMRRFYFGLSYPDDVLESYGLRPDFLTFFVDDNKGNWLVNGDILYYVSFNPNGETVIPMNGVDVASLQYLQDDYFFDKEHVYFLRSRLENANPKDFKLMYVNETLVGVSGDNVYAGSLLLTDISLNLLTSPQDGVLMTDDRAWVDISYKCWVSEIDFKEATVAEAAKYLPGC
jgi:hypothetical protein